MAFEYLQGWWLHCFCGHPVPVLCHSHRKKIVSWRSEGTSGVSVCTHYLWSVTGHHWKVTGSVLSASSLKLLTSINKILMSLLFSRLNNLSQPFLKGEMVQSPHHFCGTALDSLQFVHFSFVLGSPRTGHSSLGVASSVLKREEGSPTSVCSRYFVWCSPGYRLPPLPQGHISGSLSALSLSIYSF